MVGAGFEPDAQAAEPVQQCEGLFDRPAIGVQAREAMVGGPADEDRPKADSTTTYHALDPAHFHKESNMLYSISRSSDAPTHQTVTASAMATRSVPAAHRPPPTACTGPTYTTTHKRPTQRP